MEEITAALLQDLYVNQGKSMREIGLLVGKSTKQVCRYIHKYGIEPRAFTTKGLSPKRQPLSEETKRKISKAHTGKKLSPEHREKVIRSLRFGLKGKDNPCWKGGRSHDGWGYVLVLLDGKYVKEHRLVMERYLGRKLTRSEHIHHINGDKTDNRLENLLLISPSEHSSLHESDLTRKEAKSEHMKEYRKINFWSSKRIENYV